MNSSRAVLRMRLMLAYIPKAALCAVMRATAEDKPVTVSAYTGRNKLYAQLK